MAYRDVSWLATGFGFRYRTSIDLALLDVARAILDHDDEQDLVLRIFIPLHFFARMRADSLHVRYSLCANVEDAVETEIPILATFQSGEGGDEFVIRLDIEELVVAGCRPSTDV